MKNTLLLAITLCFTLVASVPTENTPWQCEGEQCELMNKKEAWRYPCKVSTSFSTVLEPLVFGKDGTTLEKWGLIWLYYDLPHERIRMDIHAVRGGKQIKHTLWIFFKDHKYFMLDRMDSKCKKGAFQGDMKSPQIPMNASFLTTIQRGEEVLEMWKIPVKKEGKDFLVTIENTVGTCVPVNLGVFEWKNKPTEPVQHHFDHYHNLKIKTLATFVNYGSGVSPYHFELHKGCEGVSETGEQVNLDQPVWPMQMLEMMTMMQ